MAKHLTVNVDEGLTWSEQGASECNNLKKLRLVSMFIDTDMKATES